MLGDISIEITYGNNWGALIPTEVGVKSHEERLMIVSMFSITVAKSDPSVLNKDFNGQE